MKRLSFILATVFILSLFVYSVNQNYNLKTIDSQSETIQSEMILGNYDNDFDCLIVELFHYETSFHNLGASINLNCDCIDHKSIVQLSIFGFA